MKRNWFHTLNDALESEGLIETWNPSWAPIQYGETRQYHVEDGTRHGHHVSIYRDGINGMYERPVHYAC